MTVGILSDTHDNLFNIEKAVRLFNAAGTGFVVHCGDFVAPFTMQAMRRLRCPWQGVFGNNDGERRGLTEKSEGRIRRPPLRLTLDRVRVTVVHDLSGLALDEETASVILHGHTHSASVIAKAGKLIVNPGECGGWLYGKPSVAIVDLTLMKARIHRLSA